MTSMAELAAAVADVQQWLRKHEQRHTRLETTLAAFEAAFGCNSDNARRMATATPDLQRRCEGLLKDILELGRDLDLLWWHSLEAAPNVPLLVGGKTLLAQATRPLTAPDTDKGVSFFLRPPPAATAAASPR